MNFGGKTKDMIGALPALASTSVTAGGSGDNTEITGISIDRFYGSNDIYGDVTLLIALDDLNLAASETLSLTITIQDSANNSDWNTAESVLAKTAVYTGEIVSGYYVYKIGVNLTMYDRYVRLNVTPDMSAADTDTVTINGIAVMGYPTYKPVS
jgi:hypothetical protein